MGGQASSPGRSRSMTARSLSLMSRIFAVQRLSFVPWSVNSAIAFHSITSSASVSRLSEILSPSAFAVFRLITSSNLLGR
jgi:hypothetical protein